MAVGGAARQAYKIAKSEDGYCIVQSEGRPGHILSTPELAHDALLSGLNVWIAATDKAQLEFLLGKEIRARV